MIILATKNIHRNLGTGTAGQQDILGTGRQKLNSGDTGNAKLSSVTWDYFNCLVFVLQKISGYIFQLKKKQFKMLINKEKGNHSLKQEIQLIPEYRDVFNVLII